MEYHFNKFKIKTKNIVIFILLWTIISYPLMSEFSFPNSISYLNDFLLLILLLVSLKYYNKMDVSRKKYINPIIVIVFIYLFICIFSAVLNNTPIPLFFWAIRNNFRFFLYFILCIIYLDKTDYTKLFHCLFVIQIISFLLSLYQLFL